MKKTNKEFAEFYGIEVGDTVTIYNEDGRVYGTFKCRDLEAQYPLKVIECIDYHLNAMSIGHIRERRYEVSKPKKKYGETKCSDNVDCENCPLELLVGCCFYRERNYDLYHILDLVCDEYDVGTDNPVYKAFRAELDKEVVE